MKRNIEVKEKELIDRLNKNNRFYMGVDIGEEGGDKSSTAVYYNDERNEEAHVMDAPDARQEEKACTQSRTYIKPTTTIDLPYEEVNHPKHYNNYDVEVIDMMERIFGKEETKIFCKLNAFKYRMRAGTKPNTPVQKDLDKEQWYLDKFEELKK